ncbi:MAG: PSD1 and planctomycete cytochrome C domain-containing protein [Limisphaerales bacterium]
MRTRHFPWLLCFVWMLTSSTGGTAAEISPEQLDFFEKRIRPVLVDRCYQCHSAQADDLKGGLRLDSKTGTRLGGVSGKPTITPHNPASSFLIEVISYKHEKIQMPPKTAGGQLSDAQIADFIEWVNMGAPDPRTGPATLGKPARNIKEHWAFKPLRESSPPPVKNTKWAKTPIDQFILARLEENDLQPSPEADRRTLIRRATFDLTGLPPTFQEIESFVNDNSPDAFEKVVDRLLASPRYGERWGRHWLDVARYADTKGYVYGREETRFVHSYAYRDWVIRALNEDMPYDQFLRLQLAADQIDGADREALAAMGFLTLGRRFLGVVHDIIDDRIDVVTRGTLGLTVSCARCHDHKYDPVPTADYYSLYGVFSGSSERAVPLSSAGISAKAYLDFETELNRRTEKYQSVLNAKREQQNRQFRAQVSEYLLAVLDVHKFPSEEFYSFVQADEVNPVVVRRWNSYLLGTKKNDPVWAAWHLFAALPPDTFTIKAGDVISSLPDKSNSLVRKAFEAKSPSSMRDVATIYGELFAAVEKKMEGPAQKKVALSNDEEQLRQVLHGPASPAAVPTGALVDIEWYFDEPTRVELGKLFVELERWIVQSPGAPPYAVILEDRPTQTNPRIFRRGSPSNKGEEVPRRFLEILSPQDRKPFVKGSGRLELAEAIASRDNPLTARVMVNRIWAHHFGAGLVTSTSDFGLRADPPSHPELLDWLALEFMNENWSMKKLHRLIMLSAVYQQSSAISDITNPANTLDPENRLLWRMNRSRLDFEALRDALLFAAGELDLKPGGRADDLFKTPFSKRRTVYGYIDRKFLPGTLRVFDFANPDMHTPQRSETTVPQQALFFLNGKFVVEQSRALAARVEESISGTGITSTAGNQGNEGAHRSKSAEQKIQQFYKLVYQRVPTPQQLEAGIRFVQEAEVDWKEELTSRAPSNWKYGYGEFDQSTQMLQEFKELPYFTGEAWQGGRNWPDAKLGWLQLTATGGHAGNDLQHAVVRRWVAPVDGTISINGILHHQRTRGEGIRAYMVSSRHGLLGQWVLHNQQTGTKAENLAIKEGDTIDFIVSIHTSLNNNDFIWTPIIRMVGPTAIRDSNGYAREWNAEKEFAGPPEQDLVRPLTAWEKYAQVLLLSNEFVFVD